jgi:hypothetical protein
MSFTYTQSGPNPVGTLNLNTAHLKLTYQDKKLIFFNNVSLGGSGSNIVASNSVQAPGFQFANTSSNGIVYASNGVMTTAGSGFTISGDTLTAPNLVLTGNLQVNGTVTTVNTTTLVITDPIVQIGSNITDTTNVGLIFTSGPSFANVAFGFTPGSNTMILTGTSSSAYGTVMDSTSQVNFNVNGVLTANAFIGDGGLLSNIPGGTATLQDVTTNGNVTTDYVTLGGLTTTDGSINGVSVQSTSGGNTGFFVTPVRYVAGGSSNVLGYNTSTGEIFDTGSSGGGGGSQTLQEVMDLGATSNVTMSLTNATTGLNVSSNVIIGGNISMPGGNMNAYSVSLMSAAIDTLNANQVNAGILGLTGNLSAHANVVVDQGLSAQTVTANVVTANTFVGSGAGLTNVITASTLQQVTNNGATSNNTVSFTNATTGFIVSSNATIGGNLEMAAGNMNVYSVSTHSVAADVVNVTEVQATSVASVGATIYGTTTSEKVISNVVTSNALVTQNILADDASVTGDLTVDGVTTVQILKFTPYSGIDPDTGNASVIATATGNTVTVNATGVVYGSNVINLSGYTSPIRSFNLNVDANAQIYLFAPGVSVNTTSTATVKYTNPTPITNSNVLFHVTTIAYAGFSVVNAIVVN